MAGENIVSILVKAVNETGPGFAEASAGAKELAVEEKIAGDEAEVTAEKTSLSSRAAAAGGAAWAKFGLIGSAALAGVGYESIKMAMSFQSSMERLVTQAGVPQKELGSLKQGVLNLAGQVGFSPDSLAVSLYHVASSMASLGTTGPQMLNLVKIAAEGAKVGGANLEEVTNALTSAVASGIPGVQNYAQAMGALNAIVGAGDMKMQDLAEAMGSGVLSVVKGYGLSLKDVGATLATFGDLNVRGANAATFLRMAVQSLAVPAAAGKKELESMGLSMTSLRDTMQQHGLLPALEELKSHMTAAGVSATQMGGVITEVFGKRAGPGLAILLENMDRLKSKYPAITEGASKFGAAWAATQQTTKQKMDELRATFEALGTRIGTALLPVISTFASVLLKLAPTLTALAPAILTIVAAMTAWAGIMKVVNILSDMNPWVIAIMAIVVAVTLLVEHWKTVKRIAEEVFRPVAAILGGVADAFVAMGHDVEAAVDHVVSFVQAHWKLLIAFILGPLGLIIDAIVTHWAAVKHVFEAGWRFVESVTKAFWDGFLKPYIMTQVHAIEAILNWFGKLAGLFRGWFAAAARAVASEIDKLIHFVESIPGRVNSALGGLPGMMFRAGVHAIESLISGITSMIGSVVSAVGNIAGKVAGFFGLSPAKEGPLSAGGAPWIRGQHIVQDIASGMMSQKGALAQAAHHIAGTAAGAVAGGAGVAAGGAGGGALVIQFRGGGGSGLDQMFWTWLKNGVRAQGGDPRIFNKKVQFLGG